MAWTSPRTWVAGEIVTAALMNTHVRDNLNAIGTFAAYTPALTGTSNPAIGNGTAVGRYIQAGKLVFFTVKITFGSTSTYGSGSWFVSLPVARGSGGVIRATCFYEDASSSARYLGQSYAGTTTTLGLGVDASGAGGVLSAVIPTAPFTWATGDIIEVSGTYEAA